MNRMAVAKELVRVAKELLWKKPDAKTKQRLEYLRKELEAERISYGELSELQDLAEYISPDDVQLLEAAGIPEGTRRKKAKKVVAVPMSFDAPTMETTRWAERTLRVALNADASWKKIYELFMTVEEGTSNKFHYFAVFRSRTGECAGGNSYGRIGYNPKAIEVARGSEGSVMADVRAKASIKQRSRGYQIREV